MKTGICAFYKHSVRPLNTMRPSEVTNPVADPEPGKGGQKTNFFTCSGSHFCHCTPECCRTYPRRPRRRWCHHHHHYSINTFINFSDHFDHKFCRYRGISPKFQIWEAWIAFNEPDYLRMVTKYQTYWNLFIRMEMRFLRALDVKTLRLHNRQCSDRGFFVKLWLNIMIEES